MKKEILCVAFVFLMSGCSSEVKADKKMVCALESTNEGSMLNLKSEISYHEEKDVPILGNVETTYSKLVVSPTTNSIFVSLKEKSSIIAQIDGVEVTSSTLEDGFTFIETWDYNKIDVKKAVDIDETQATFIEEDAYSVKKMKKHYEALGYTCDSQDIKK